LILYFRALSIGFSRKPAVYTSDFDKGPASSERVFYNKHIPLAGNTLACQLSKQMRNPPAGFTIVFQVFRNGTPFRKEGKYMACDKRMG
jgi:hypothetical protein